MPIITIQRRHAEQGRIRLGQKVATQSGKTRPDKLDRFRFTSANQGLIEQIAAKYGGEARPWDNDGKAEFEVISDARQIPVIVVKGGFSQWHEVWSKAGCLHRCDGEKDAGGIYCDPNDPQHKAAIEKPTTRLSVMLEEIGGLGTWRMESKGWNAAAELPNMAELAMHVGDLVPATLYLAERTSVIEGPRGPQKSRYVVPGLDLNVTKAQLVQIAGGIAGGASQIGGSNSLQIESGMPSDYEDEVTDQISDLTTVDELRVLWQQVNGSGRMTPRLAAALEQRATELSPKVLESGDTDEAAPAESSADAGERDALQMQILTAAGKKGMSGPDVLADIEQQFAIPADEATVEQLREYLEGLAA